MAEVRPIAGTRPRGATPEDDRRLAADSGRRKGAGRARDAGGPGPRRFGPGVPGRLGPGAPADGRGKYSHVMHIVSDVVGELADGRTAFDLLRAAFPAGTVSGAPKARALELIGELEPGGAGPTPARWATSASRATWIRASPSGPSSCGAAWRSSRPARASWPTRIRIGNCKRSLRKRAPCCKRWPLRKGCGYDRRHRQRDLFTHNLAHPAGALGATPVVVRAATRRGWRT